MLFSKSTHQNTQIEYAYIMVMYLYVNEKSFKKWFFFIDNEQQSKFDLMLLLVHWCSQSDQVTQFLYKYHY
jgi:hypothetical protein